jgi:coenzyme F420-0:L-glutamate ligase/coenzyme F420-1:gamma-L-glutamate ligase
MPAPSEIRILALGAFPEVTPGMDLPPLILAAAADAGVTFAPGDVLVVTQKIVSKAEGALVDLRAIEPSDLAARWAATWGKDPRQIEVVLRESKRIVRMANGIIISDSFGRPGRYGIINVAVGLAGMGAVADYRGQTDSHGYLLNASILAVADELAAAAELIMGKLDGRPVAVIRGYAYEAANGTAQDLLMDPARDLFR